MPLLMFIDVEQYGRQAARRPRGPWGGQSGAALLITTCQSGLRQRRLSERGVGPRPPLGVREGTEGDGGRGRDPGGGRREGGRPRWRAEGRGAVMKVGGEGQS